ncbi:MAG: hypothetical protein JRI23_23140 [Deltaproteobacteria bacterium]|jgi:hypothetical protein|nr:hypothetical protein [Deltaproteobacteria bacterium]MBW2534868.1 hypothetical protein [Deltaproteobacteria bacterium]
MTRRIQYVRAAALAGVVLTCSTLAACEADRGKSFDCRCHFLTDFDDPSTQAVEICAASDEEAGQVARGCAQSAAPAPIQSCSCTPAPSSTPCSKGSCRAK